MLAIPAVALRLPLLYLPGFWVLLALLLTIGMRGTPWQVQEREALGAAWRQFTPSATSILLFLLTAQVMQASAMMASLGAATAALGKEYVWISPWVAGLGAWMTGSNLGGTVMCSLLQKAAAAKTGLSLLWLAAAQNGAGQLTRMLSPACLMLAATSTGLKGQEGVLLRKCGPLVLWVMALMLLLLASCLIPSPLLLCVWRPGAVALLAWTAPHPVGSACTGKRERQQFLPKKSPPRQRRANSGSVERGEDRYAREAVQEGAQRARPRSGQEEPAFLESGDR